MSKVLKTISEIPFYQGYKGDLLYIHDLCVDYDGYNTEEGLKCLIDEIREFSIEAINFYN